MAKFVLLLMGLMSIVCFADVDTVCNHEIVLQILANEKICVEKFETEKIYLNADRIYVTNCGIYLNLNDVDFVMLNTVSSDAQGCYIEVRQILNNCPYCGKPYFVRCRNPDCPGKKKSH